MTKTEVKSVFGTITVLAKKLNISSQAVSQWFDENGQITDLYRQNAVIGAAYSLGKNIPNSWISSLENSIEKTGSKKNE